MIGRHRVRLSAAGGASPVPNSLSRLTCAPRRSGRCWVIRRGTWPPGDVGAGRSQIALQERNPLRRMQPDPPPSVGVHLRAYRILAVGLDGNDRPRQRGAVREELFGRSCAVAGGLVSSTQESAARSRWTTSREGSRGSLRTSWTPSVPRLSQREETGIVPVVARFEGMPCERLPERGDLRVDLSKFIRTPAAPEQTGDRPHCPVSHTGDRKRNGRAGYVLSRPPARTGGRGDVTQGRRAAGARARGACTRPAGCGRRRCGVRSSPGRRPGSRRRCVPRPWPR